MFPNGVGAYVDLMQDLIPEMKDGTVRTAIDTGCGVSPFYNSLGFPSHSIEVENYGPTSLSFLNGPQQEFVCLLQKLYIERDRILYGLVHTPYDRPSATDFHL